MLFSTKQCSQIVEVEHNDQTFTFAVWLFQEGERVSADHLFGVRLKQPYSCATHHKGIQVCESNPTAPTVITVGDIYAFKFPDGEWKIGKILQFCYINEKKKKRPYKGSNYDSKCEVKQTGVMCLWFTSPKDLWVQYWHHWTDNGNSLFFLCKFVLAYTSTMVFRIIGLSGCKHFYYSDRIALMTAHKVTLTIAAIGKILIIPYVLEMSNLRMHPS